MSHTPILNLNFANAKQLIHPAVVFSRASTRGYTDSTGALRIAALGVPRFPYSADGDCLGLQIQPQEAMDSVLYAADICTIDLTQLKRDGSPLWTGAEGTIVIDAVASVSSATPSAWQYLFQLDDGSASNRILVARDQSGGINVMSVVAGVFKTTTPTGVVVLNGSRLRLVMSVGSGKSSVSISGSAVINTNTHVMPVLSSILRFYSLGSPSSSQFGGAYRLVQVYNRSIADAYLPMMSTI